MRMLNLPDTQDSANPRIVRHFNPLNYPPTWSGWLAVRRRRLASSVAIGEEPHIFCIQDPLHQTESA